MQLFNLCSLPHGRSKSLQCLDSWESSYRWMDKILNEGRERAVGECASPRGCWLDLHVCAHVVAGALPSLKLVWWAYTFAWAGGWLGEVT